MRKNIIIFMLVLIFCSVLAVGAFAGRFYDVPDEKWYSDGISFCAANGYMDGVAEGKFDRQSDLTRAMFMTILAKVDGVDLAEYEGKSSFSDVKTDGWYTAAIEWAARNNITGGVGNDFYGRPVFGYKNSISREQVALFFYVYSNYVNQRDAISEDFAAEAPVADYSSVQQEYDDAVAMTGGIPGHRDIGLLQSETQEIIILEDEYYQSYVATTHDMRYIFVSNSESEMTAFWNWMPIGTRDDYSLDNLGRIEDDMRGDDPSSGRIDLTPRADLTLFTDGERTHAWAREATEWAVAVGLISGTSDTTLSPRGNCSRAEAAVMIRAYVLNFLTDCEHDWVDATCIDMGYCTKCDLKSATELGHDVGERDCTVVTPCLRCDEEIPGVEHKLTAPTCIAAAKCTVCSAVVGEPAGHDTSNGICGICGGESFITPHHKLVYYLNTKGQLSDNGYKCFSGAHVDENNTNVIYAYDIFVKPGESDVYLQHTTYYLYADEPYVITSELILTSSKESNFDISCVKYDANGLHWYATGEYVTGQVMHSIPNTIEGPRQNEGSPISDLSNHSESVIYYAHKLIKQNIAGFGLKDFGFDLGLLSNYSDPDLFNNY